MHEVHIGARVRSSDGKRLGRIEHLIVHADSGRVDGFILDPGVIGRHKIVAAGQVASTGPKGVVLSLDARAAHELPEEIHERLMRAPGSLTYGVGMGGLVDIRGTGSEWVVRGPARSMYAQVPIGEIDVVDVSNLPDDAVMVDTGTDVVGSDGKKIGHVDELVVGNDRRVTEIVVRAGWLFRHDLAFPAGLVAGTTHDRVRLSITADEAEHFKADDD